MRAYIVVLGMAALLGACGEDRSATGPLDPNSPTIQIGAAASVAGDSAVLITDRPDYSPGDTITFIGSGFQPDEVVTITLHEDPQTHDDLVFTDTADVNGDFENRDFVAELHHLNVAFHAVAEGSLGSHAEAFFTDGARISSVAVQGLQNPNPVLAGSVASFGNSSSSVRVAFNANLLGTCTVSLSATGLPPGATASFVPGTVSGTAGQFVTTFLTVNTAVTTSGGVHSFTVQATGTGGLGNSCTSADVEIAFANLNVQPNVGTSLALAVPSPVLVTYGSQGPVTFAATLTRAAGGTPVAGATIGFTVDGVDAGTAVTNSSGTATLATYNPAALLPGNHPVIANFAGGVVGGNSLTPSVSGQQTLSVSRATPELAWQNPADITYGTPLSSTQLNASAAVAGTFTYNPVAGTVLELGNGQTLHVVFSPADATRYNGASRSVSINVRGAALSVIADDKSKIHGGANPTLTGSISGIQNDDPISATFSTSATTLSPPGTYAIVPALSDPNGRLRNYQLDRRNGTLTVLPNALPVLGNVTWPVSPIPVGKTIAATATFTDADVPESAPYTATIAWGDGSVSTVDCASPGDISATHAYGAPGLFGITITVRQNNLPTHSDTKRLEYVVVFEDNGNFATGGGWLNAVTGLPAGAPPADKATFGFVARYDQGSSAPVGNLEFNTHDGTLRFKSVSYDWLMVDGTLARFQGVGTLNGQGQYGFLVAATAGDPGSGRMRIRIWELATNRVIYDNQFGEADGASPGVPLAGGKIQVK